MLAAGESRDSSALFNKTEPVYNKLEQVHVVMVWTSEYFSQNKVC